MSIASTIKAMRAAGVSDAQIVDAVLVLVSEDEEVKTAKRERDRLRKRAERESKKTNKNNDCVHRTLRTACDISDGADTPSPEVSPPAPPYPNPNPPKKTPPTEGQKKVPARGTRIPDDWEPDIESATKVGLSDQEAWREADKFRDYWRSTPGQKGVKLDWPATWRNWCRNAVERRGHAANRKSDRPSMHDVADRMLREAEERAGRFDGS